MRAAGAIRTHWFHALPFPPLLMGREQVQCSLKDSPAYGIWKDREDIGTGAEYVARIRKYKDAAEEK